MVESVQPFAIHRLAPEKALSIIRKTLVNSTPSSYNLLNDQQRWNLIEKFYVQKLSVKEAARLCGIKYTTAKSILKVYKNEGRFTKRRRRGKRKYESDKQNEKSFVSNANGGLTMREKMD